VKPEGPAAGVARTLRQSPGGPSRLLKPTAVREPVGRRRVRATVRLPRWLRRGPRFDLEPHVRQEATGIVLVMLAALLGVALASGTGWLTGGIARPLLRWLGWGAWALPASLGLTGAAMLWRALGRVPALKLQHGIAAVTLVATAAGLAELLRPPGGAATGGGELGHRVLSVLSDALSPVGAFILLAATGAVSAVVILNVSPTEAVRWLTWAWWQALLVLRGAACLLARAALVAYRYGVCPAWGACRRAVPAGVAWIRQRLRSRRRMQPAVTLPVPAVRRERAPMVEVLNPGEGEPVRAPVRRLGGYRAEAKEKEAALAPPVKVALSGPQSWVMPDPTRLLQKGPEVAFSATDIQRQCDIIEAALASFNVDAKVVEAHQGPSVTQFGLQLAPGVRVSKVLSLQHDLQLALAARSIRIELPINGQSLVGIEIPNATTTTVTLRELLLSDEFRKLPHPKLRVALGRDVAGRPRVADLARMPHLLVAGTTGSGKSSFLNSLIASLLFQCTPEELRLILIDPKMVEFVNYNEIPHLLRPVVTEPEEAVRTLAWAAREMDRRYHLLSERFCRNIDSYNALGPEALAEAGGLLPYIVIIIDELADLMMLAPDDVERHICRLAQKARATGIHLVVATQRPSVDVITGLIKANFPSRISFALSSQADSRTILDSAGAEKLVGRGDGLYLPADENKLVRIQSAYVHDKELEALISFWKEQGKRNGWPRYIDDSEINAQPIQTDQVATEEDEDELLEKAKEIVRQYSRASTSLLQRRLRIGYARAARLIDALEAEGIVGPDPGGGRSREVLAPLDLEGPPEPPFRSRSMHQERDGRTGAGTTDGGAGDA
jgi:S-DNA-T family DNA segregation ATPase FtsK/SpoIIIE